MAKKKVPIKYRQKAIMERAMKERKAPPTPPKKKMNWKKFFRALPGRIARFFRDVVHELRRVTWPSRKALLTYTLVVIVALIFFSALLGLIDFMFIELVDFLSALF